MVIMYTFEAKYYDSKFNKTRKRTIQFEEQFAENVIDAWQIAVKKASHDYLPDGTEVPLARYLELLEVKFISC